MRKIRVLLLAAPLFFGAAFDASAKPHPAKPANVAPAPARRLAPNMVEGPFRDVPPDHWAARAVETLRQVGIVRGYPGTASQPQAAKAGRAR